jgi:hypothetical protein
MQERKPDPAAFPPTYSDYFINSTHQEFLMDYLLHLQLLNFNCLKLLSITGTNMYANKETSSHRRGINIGLWGR